MAKTSVNGGIGNRSKTQERKRSKKRIKSRKCGKFLVFFLCFLLVIRGEICTFAVIL